MGLADELWKLQEMHQRGELTDSEFAQAKAALLAGANSSGGEQLEQLSQQMDEVARRQRVADIDREWDQERLQYLASGTTGGTHNAQGQYVGGGVPFTYVPTKGGSIALGAFAAVAGTAWMAFAASIGAGAFALFGLVFILFGIGMAVFNYNKAANYEEAHAAYLERRREALEGNNSSRYADQAPEERQWKDSPPNVREGRPE